MSLIQRVIIFSAFIVFLCRKIDRIDSALNSKLQTDKITSNKLRMNLVRYLVSTKRATSHRPNSNGLHSDIRTTNGYFHQSENCASDKNDCTNQNAVHAESVYEFMNTVQTDPEIDSSNDRFLISGELHTDANSKNFHPTESHFNRKSRNLNKIFRWRIPYSFYPQPDRSNRKGSSHRKAQLSLKSKIFHVKDGVLIGLPLAHEQVPRHIIVLRSSSTKETTELQLDFIPMGSNLTTSMTPSNPIFVVEFNSSYAVGSAAARLKIAQMIADVFQINVSELTVHSILPPSVRWSAPVKSIDLNRIFYRKLKHDGLQGTKGIVNFRSLGYPGDLLTVNANIAAAMAIFILVVGFLLTVVIGLCIYFYSDANGNKLSKLEQRVWINKGNRYSKSKRRGIPVILCEELEDAPLHSRSPVLLRFERPPMYMGSPSPPTQANNNRLTNDFNVKASPDYRQV